MKPLDVFLVFLKAYRADCKHSQPLKTFSWASVFDVPIRQEQKRACKMSWGQAVAQMGIWVCRSPAQRKGGLRYMEGKGKPGTLGASKTNVANRLQSEPECLPPVSTLLSSTINYHPQPQPLLGSPWTLVVFHWETSKTWSGPQRNLVVDGMLLMHQCILSPKGWSRVCDPKDLPATLNNALWMGRV